MNSNHFFFCALAIVTFASCQEEDYGFDRHNIQYEMNFKRTFGDIPEGQNWDFYAQAMNGAKTRAVSADGIEISDVTSYDHLYGAMADFSKYVRTNLTNTNSNTGFPTGRYISTGEFTVYSSEMLFGTGLIGGGDASYLGVGYKGENYTIEGIKTFGNYHAISGCTININPGDEFCFYMYYRPYSYQQTRVVAFPEDVPYRTFYDVAILDNKVTPIMVFAFRINPKDGDEYDSVFFITGNLPMIEAKRYMCEDLGGNQSTDLDFNDIVFDLQPSQEQGTDVILRSVGGTLPIKLWVNDEAIGDGELHEFFGQTVDEEGLYQPINVGKEVTAEAKIVNLPNLVIDDLSKFNNIRAEVTHPDGVQRITFEANASGASPKIFAVPVSTLWMKDDKNIKNDCYHDFFGGEWYKNPSSVENLYHDYFKNE